MLILILIQFLTWQLCFCEKAGKAFSLGVLFCMRRQYPPSFPPQLDRHYLILACGLVNIVAAVILPLPRVVPEQTVRLVYFTPGWGRFYCWQPQHDPTTFTPLLLTTFFQLCQTGMETSCYPITMAISATPYLQFLILPTTSFETGLERPDRAGRQFPLGWCLPFFFDPRLA